MKVPTLLLSAVLAAAAAIPFGGTPTVADDGELLRKSMSKAAGQPQTDPVSEAEHAFIDTMNFYVPAQASNGDVTPIDYNDIDGMPVDTRESAKPLIGVYIFGPVEGVPDVGFVGHGKRDAYAAVSLDDGVSWKRTNLSESAAETSSTVWRDDIALFEDTGFFYPGDVINVFQATAANRALVAWPSRYCSSGSPNYALDNDPLRRDAIAAYLGIDLESPSPDDLYLIDMFGVAGQQGSVDYSEDKFPQNQAVAEVPFACLWAARGILVEGDDPRTTDAVEANYMRWFKAERLTSGRRDVNRVEVKMVAGAGASVTWQEDPEGLRPGQGEGPGEGWSGAIGNSQTDVWYSYIPWSSFDLVEDPENAEQILTLEEFLTAGNETKPKVGIPMAMPMRVTDNAKCNVTNPQPYCNGSAISDLHLDVLNPLDYGMRDMCADTVQIPTGPMGSLADVCVTEDGLPLVGNIAATRPRLGLYGYDSDQDQVVDSAWMVFVAEESKGLGAFGFNEIGEPCNPDDDGCTAFDEGKNLWYYTFGMSLTDVSAGGDDSLIANLAGHGNQLNQPELDWESGAFYPVANTAEMWDFGDYNYDIYNTEIARRGSLLAQPIAKVHKTDSATKIKSKSRLLALPAWKQGIMNQGGPADVMVRRILLPRTFKARPAPSAAVAGRNENPYRFTNMDCKSWVYQDGSNPYYPDGLCLDPAINLSASVPDSCVDSQSSDVVACPTVDENGIGDTNPILQGSEVEPNTIKVLTWHQCPAAASLVSASDDLVPATCAEDDDNLSDQSWYNPLDVAKGHRGYLDGDFVMLLYAWSPNWRLNAKGSDRYELYIRRSFDGGQSWTTLPADYKHFDGEKYNGAGTVTCETYRTAETGGGGGLEEPHACNEYAAGAPEQARNVSQLKSMAFTVLDPRFASTPADIEDANGVPEEDERDPSRYFIVFETGDNSTVEEGEAEPLDLFYSRGVHFGDNYQVWAEEVDLSLCYPSDPHETDVPEEIIASGFCNEFDDLEGKKDTQSSEASLEANPSGSFMYGVWAQWAHDELSGELTESDAMARRVWYIDDYISATEAWSLPGTGGGP